MRKRIRIMKYLFQIIFVFICCQVRAHSEPIIRLNHLLIVVDSSTYDALTKSSFIKNEFGYSNHRKFENWEGFYIIGSNNYLEIFHPNSIAEEKLLAGENWTCFASMKSGHLASITYDSSYVRFIEDSNFKYLSCHLNDSISPFEVWEMNKKQYESWTNKKFEPGMSFNPVDYNSPAESDSAKNYLLNDVVNITYWVPRTDSLKTLHFFENCGYNKREKSREKLFLSNGTETITLDFSKGTDTLVVGSIQLSLNYVYPRKIYEIGNTSLSIVGKSALWKFY